MSRTGVHPSAARTHAGRVAAPRWRRWAVLASLLVLAAGGALSGIWVVAGSSVIFEGSVVHGKFEQVDDDPFDERSRLEIIDPAPGATRYDVVLQNTGRFDVRVRARPVGPAVRVGLASHTAQSYRFLPLGGRDIVIQPGNQAYLQLELTWPCGRTAADTTVGIDAVPLDFTVLGVTRTAEFELPQAVRLRTTTDLEPGPEWGCS